MTRSAPSSGAVPRPARGAAGRRALQAVLLAGGLSALGFLLGGQAHAADGPAHPIRLAHPAPAQGVTETRSPHSAPIPTVSVTRTPPGRLPKPADRTGPAATAPRPGTALRPATDPAPLSVAITCVGVGVEHLTGAAASPPASPRTGTRARGEADAGRSTPPGSAYASRAVERRRQVTEGVERAVPSAVGSVPELIRPVEATVVRPVTGAVGRPGGALTDVLSGGPPTPPDTLPSLPGLPAHPALPALPVLPALPQAHLPALPGVPGGTFPEVPEVPVLPALPGVDPQDPPRAEAPQAERGAAEERSAGRAVAVVDASSLSGPAGAATWEPTYGPGRPDARSGSAGVRRGPDGAGPGPVFGRQTPPGGASGATGSRSALDNAAPRHAEVPAVTPSHRAPQRLARGTSTATPASGTGDRYRDIPVFPG
ncbi:hypothetical protein [Streptomyces sp. NPDC048643]|uniref:hypothetical protein n=1 Tax=Streptomyces sp. NPDC048643 TaxID=3155637 RepID=UPI00341E8F3E